ncbi:signal peptidase I [Paenibacillus sp. 32O-W]|uniref:signal peptidase I n=1 Tax=Paenibacillus sp. 32O-W TaxID=1695218 RepID=UPI00119D4A2E|nr:signal peptidase I [Paenibacillus sp. 32O-W]
MNPALDNECKDPAIKERREQSHGSFAAELWDWIKSISVALLVVVIVNQFVFSQSIVDGHSMEPTLSNGERLFVNRIIYRFTAPHYGDIVIFKDPAPTGGSRDYLVKRVIAEAGDWVEIRSGKLYVNDQLVEEDYVSSPIEDGDFGPYQVNEGHLFVLGDNRRRSASRDSRTFGAIAQSAVVGKAVWVIWPLNKFGGV